MFDFNWYIDYGKEKLIHMHTNLLELRSRVIKQLASACLILNEDYEIRTAKSCIEISQKNTSDIHVLSRTLEIMPSVHINIYRGIIFITEKKPEIIHFDDVVVSPKPYQSILPASYDVKSEPSVNVDMIRKLVAQTLVKDPIETPSEEHALSLPSASKRKRGRPRKQISDIHTGIKKKRPKKKRPKKKTRKVRKAIKKGIVEKIERSKKQSEIPAIEPTALSKVYPKVASVYILYEFFIETLTRSLVESYSIQMSVVTKTHRNGDFMLSCILSGTPEALARFSQDHPQWIINIGTPVINRFFVEMIISFGEIRKYLKVMDVIE